MKNRIFRLGTKIGLFGIGIGLALLAIHGCGLVSNSPTLAVSVSPKAGHPPFKIAIAAASSVPGGTYTFTSPDGDSIKSTTGQFTATVETYPYHGTISWTDGNETASQPITVGLINKAPIAHGLQISQDLEYLMPVKIDLRYREIGCHNGTPLSYVGIEDPDYTQEGYSNQNDHFTYRIEVHDKDTGTPETVFDQDGHPLPSHRFQTSPIFIWFPGWTKLFTPFPLTSINTEAVKGQDKVTTKIIRVTVREWGTDYAWEYTVQVHGNCQGG